MTHHAIHSAREERGPIFGELISERAYDASGAECLSIEYRDGKVVWMNVRDDLLDGSDPALEAMYRDVLGR